MESPAPKGTFCPKNGSRTPESHALIPQNERAVEDQEGEPRGGGKLNETDRPTVLGTISPPNIKGEEWCHQPGEWLDGTRDSIEESGDPPSVEPVHREEERWHPQDVLDRTGREVKLVRQGEG